MPTHQSPEQALRARNLLFLSDPRLWPEWPFLPLLRRRPGAEEEYGVLLDALVVDRPRRQLVRPDPGHNGDNHAAGG